MNERQKMPNKNANTENRTSEQRPVRINNELLQRSMSRHTIKSLHNRFFFLQRNLYTGYKINRDRERERDRDSAMCAFRLWECEFCRFASPNATNIMTIRTCFYSTIVCWMHSHWLGMFVCLFVWMHLQMAHQYSNIAVRLLDIDFKYIIGFIWLHL